MQLKDKNSACIPAVHCEVGVIDRPSRPAPLTSPFLWLVKKCIKR